MPYSPNHSSADRSKVRRIPLQKSPEQLKQELDQDLLSGNVSLEDAVRRIRKLTGMTQMQFAKELGIASRTYINIERGVGNPTVETLEKIGKPFGYALLFVPSSQVSEE
jgi:DNA-binding XRE family transcriptional regulator